MRMVPSGPCEADARNGERPGLRSARSGSAGTVAVVVVGAGLAGLTTGGVDGAGVGGTIDGVAALGGVNSATDGAVAVGLDDAIGAGFGSIRQTTTVPMTTAAAAA